MITLLVAAGFALVFTLVCTPLFAQLFSRIGWGQFINKDAPTQHIVKRGTPTMGGLVFIVGALFGYFVGHLVTGDGVTLSGVLALGLMVGLGFIGFLDDFTKTHRQHSRGLWPWQKLLGQTIVATAFGVLAINFPNANGQTPASLAISGVRDLPWLDLANLGVWVGGVLLVVWIVLLVSGTSNGVNLADGLDGLAGGSSIFAFIAFVVIDFWESNQSCFSPRLDPVVAAACYPTRDPIDLAVTAAAIVGALIGFLWWNTSPARIFMGDTGSLGLGGGLAALAVLSRTELLLVLVGGLFVLEAGSVILQLGVFRMSGRRKRLFRASPIHHHFEMLGWQEITIVVRFWIISALCVGAAVGIFYLEWITRSA